MSNFTRRQPIKVQFSNDYRVTGPGAIVTGGQAIDQVDGASLQTQISQTQVYDFLSSHIIYCKF